MTEFAEETAVKPEVLLLEQLLDEVAAGRLRVPRFQRPFVWRSEQMLDLFDSIERGYPVGSILVWETDLELRSLPEVAGIPIPDKPTRGTVSYLLDGHQRLSTLFGTLGRRPEPRTGLNDPWWIYRTLGEAKDAGRRYQHWAHPDEPPSHLLPMQAILRTTDFLRFGRQLARDPDTAARYDDLIDESEQVAMRFKSYKIAVIRLVGGSLSHAVEAFSRLNSAGQRVTPQQMVSALTYRNEVGDSLTDRITDIVAGIAHSGFGDIGSETVFQTVLAVAGEDDVTSPQWTGPVQGLEGRLDPAIEDAQRALKRVVQFLRYEAGVPLAWLVPHPTQIVLLAVSYHHIPDPDPAHIRALVRWFWATSWSAALSSTSQQQIGRMLEQMRDFATDHGDLDIDGQTALPFPDWFNLDDPRVRAFVVWELRELSQRQDPDGKPVDMEDLLARLGRSAYRQVAPTAAQPWRANPANFVVLPTGESALVQEVLLNLNPRLRPTILASHAIPDAAIVYLRPADVAEVEGEDAPDPQDHEVAFIKTRARELARREHAFMREFGIEVTETHSDTYQPQVRKPDRRGTDSRPRRP